VKLLVLGGGVAGLAVALAAGRGGHEVVLAERDTDTPAGDANGVFEGWQRTGVAQFRQPHNFLGLGRRLLRDRAPDVYRELLAAGAVEVEQFRFLAGAAPEPGDEDLATIGCRRPVFEAVLRRAVEAEPAIELRSGCRVTGLVLSAGRPAHVEGVVLVAVAADHHDLARRFEAAVGEDLGDRYRAVAEEDRDRVRWWGGEPIDVTDPTASMALFLRAVVYRVARADPRLLRAVARRVDLLDPPDRLEQDQELHALALDLFRGAPRPAGPSRSQMLEALAA
jgi:hypothetical protein